MLVSFRDYELEPRFDDTSWTSLKIYESAIKTGPWTQIDTQPIETSPDPADPDPISFTTENATLQPGAAWYKIQLVDNDGHTRDFEPVFNPATVEILASLDDVNAHLDGNVIEATADNTNLVQISVARIVRGYMARLFDSATLMSWSSPTTTPDIIREIAALLIASQVYFNEASRQSLEISNENFAQRMYDQAMKMMNQIIDGEIPISGEIPGGASDLTEDDFFPIDNTDRAFTLNMIL